MTHLRLVPPCPVVCWPWDLRFMVEYAGHPKGGECRTCGQNIAVPPDKALAGATCLYCAMDEGLVEAVDLPPY